MRGQSKPFTLFTMNRSLLFALLLGGCATAPTAAPYDRVILGGRVMDPETGLDAIRNVGIHQGQIAAVTTDDIRGRDTIDARGLVVAPGFIDLHSHGQDAANYALKAADGCTTALELEVGAADIDAWYASREGKSLIHFGTSVGHIPVRMAVMGDPPGFLPDASSKANTVAATDPQVEEIKKRLR